MDRRRNLLANRAFSLTYFLLLFLSIYLISRYTLGSMRTLTWGDYGYSDLLINYDAGFVRRGLLGAIVKKSSISAGSSLPYINRLLFGNFLLLSIFTTALILISKRRAGIIALLVLTMPSGILSMALSNEYWYRKEAFFYTVLSTIACIICALQRTRHQIMTRLIGFTAILAIFSTGLILPFVHESFLFLAVPAHAFLLFAAARAVRPLDHKDTKDDFAKKLVWAYLIIQLVIFLFLSHYNGNSMVSQIIWNHLLPQDRLMIAPDGQLTDAIEAIGWGLPHAFWMALQVVISGDGWYWLIPLAGGFLYCLSLTLLGKRSQRPVADIRREIHLWVICYLILFVATLPLFLLGWDWGRWLHAVNFSFVILWLTLETQNLGQFINTFPRPLKTQLLFRKSTEILQEAIGAVATFRLRNRRALIVSMLLFSVTFRIPECCIGGNSWTVSMIKNSLKALKNSHHQKTVASNNSAPNRPQ